MTQDLSNFTGESQTGVEVELGFCPIAFLLFFCRPRVEIDGVVQKKTWGTHFFPTTAGQHTVKVYFRYLFMSRCGANSLDILVRERNVTKVKSFFLGLWMFSKGSLRVAVPPTAGGPAERGRAAAGLDAWSAPTHIENVVPSRPAPPPLPSGAAPAPALDVLAIPGYELKATAGTKIASLLLGGGVFTPFASAAVDTAKMQWATPQTKGVTRNGTWLVAIGQEVAVVVDAYENDLAEMTAMEIRNRYSNASRISKEDLRQRVSGGFRNPMWIVDLSDYGGKNLTLMHRQSLRQLFAHLQLPPPDGTRFDP